MPKDMRTVKSNHNDVPSSAGFTARATCCLWNATNIISKASQLVKPKITVFQLFYSCLLAFIFTPGPMVAAATQERIYWPLAAAGLALMIAPMRAE